MNRIGLLLLFLAGDCLAHPGHGATMIHAHPSDWYLLLGAGAVLLGAILAWRGK
jgi:hypothetical protein